jgi:hypothetical protein
MNALDISRQAIDLSARLFGIISNIGGENHVCIINFHRIEHGIIECYGSVNANISLQIFKLS